CDQGRQLARIQIGILPLLLHRELQHFAFEFEGTLAASLVWQQGAESQLIEGFPNLVEALSAEAKLAAGLADAEPFGSLGAQHLILDLSAIVRIEAIPGAQFRSNLFWLCV